MKRPDGGLVSLQGIRISREIIYGFLVVQDHDAFGVGSPRYSRTLQQESLGVDEGVGIPLETG